MREGVMNEEMAKALRAPFNDALVSKLPKITCGNCSKSQSRNCDKHQKSKCPICQSYITSAHLHLDYVGHAETTDRLLAVDPEWSWEPVAFSPDGLPKLDGNGGLWMRLTVGGVTRLGYGDAQGKNGPNAIKEAIGDGIRNAAMRFGVALDLWAKSDLAAVTADKETGEIAGPPLRQETPRTQAPIDAEGAGAGEPMEPVSLTPKQALWRYAQGLGWSASKMDEEFTSWSKTTELPKGASLRSASDDQVQAFLIDLRSEAQAA
jgi:hypothetical protein